MVFFKRINKFSSIEEEIAMEREKHKIKLKENAIKRERIQQEIASKKNEFEKRQNGLKKEFDIIRNK